MAVPLIYRGMPLKSVNFSIITSLYA